MVLEQVYHFSCVKNFVIGNGQTRFLYSKRRLLTQQIWEFLQVAPGPFPDFLGGAWGIESSQSYLIGEI